MKYGTLAHLKPYEKVGLLLLISIFTSLLFQMCGLSITGVLFGHGFNNPPDHESTDIYGVYSLRILHFFTHVGVFIMPALVFARICSFDYKDYIFINKRIDIKILIGAFVAIFGSIILLAEVNQHLGLQWLPEDISEPIIKAQKVSKKSIDVLLNGSLGALFANLFIMALLPAIGEELMFRGIVQHLFSKWFQNVHLGILVSALLFTYLHYQYLSFMPMLFFALALGYLVVLTNNIIYGMIIHFANNAFMLIVSYLETNKIIDETHWLNHSFGLYISLSFIGLAICYYLLKSKNLWHETKGIYLR